MECRMFEMNLISAIDLENVRKICKMKVYARVSIGNQPDSEKRTPVDRHGKTNPAWNFTIKRTISERVIEQYNSMLVIKLYCKRKLGDRYIGEVHLSMKELYEYAYPSGGSAIVNHPVQKGCVHSQGMLKFSYRFGDKFSIDKLLLAESLGYGVP
ncbi:C2 domain-containing protein [Heracleum sosnowskyi]|uniref:C2 domain-containing protein n=1 Tax=Heracleum sosnowskyi TaxID=360622 RepID=A0AAD8MTG0_9APIA|nr:C2 domain-containing protein [Heracleum sosnowskyi]